VYTFFAPYLFSYPLSLLPPGTNPPTLGRTCSALLFSDFVGKKKRKTMTFFLFEIKLDTQGVFL
jgi:hypothetical protein